MASLTLRGVSKRFGRRVAVRDVDLEVADGELVVFVGPSGCGKSTLLRLIAGLEELDDGEIQIGGDRVDELPPRARGVAMVFQSYALYPHMSVFQNMAFGLELGRLGRDEIRERVVAAAEKLKIAELLDRRPRELSGGQRQRVAIGRAIVRRPRVFLFDEPLSNLDAGLRVQTRVELAQLHAETRTTTVYVTHDQTEAMTLADRMVVLNAGRVEQVGTPLEVYHRPCNLFVAGFVGSPRMNVLPARVAGDGGDAARLEFAAGGSVALPRAPALADGMEVRVGIRPEHVAEDPDGPLAATVDVVEELGDSHLVHYGLADGSRVTRKGNGQASSVSGGAVRLALAPARLHLFDAAGTALPDLPLSNEPPLPER